MPNPPSLFRLPDEGVARFRAALDSAGFTQEGVETGLRIDVTEYGRRLAPILLRRTADGSRLSTLIRLFVGLLPVAHDAAEEALAPASVPDLVSAGVLAVEPGEGVRALVQLRHHRGLVVATDPEPALTGHPPAEEHVMGLSRGTLLLARLTDTVAVDAALDVGTGAGLQALMLARHARAVVATDITERAVAVARFNAELNGVATVDVRRGDLFEPVAGERFDLVVSNPPYVVGPPVSQRFMSARLEGDEVCARVARSAPAHLRPGGRAAFLAEWIVPSRQDWQERLSRWFEGNGCDTSVLAFSTLPVDEYAARWIPAETHDAAGFAREFAAWMRWYEERGVEAVTFGLVTMRRREQGGESLQLTTPAYRFNDIDGDDLQLGLALGRWVSFVDDDALLRARLRLHEGTRLLLEHAAEEGRWVVTGSLVGVENGFAPPVAVDSRTAGFVALCDGRRSVADILRDMARASDDAFGALAAATLPHVRGLVERGVLLPLDDDDDD